MADEAPATGGASLPDLPDATPVSVHLNRDFRVLWLARTMGQTAANTAQFGSLIVIVENTGSGFLSSIVVLSWVLPAALISILSGLIVDRVPKKWMLFVANGLRASGCFVFILSSQGTVEIFILVLFLASLGPFVGPAESALVPTLVRRENLTAANAFLNLMRYVAQIAGLVVLAPVLVRVAGVDALFITTGALFAGSAVYSALIPMGVVTHHDSTDIEFPDEEARPRTKGLREARDFLRGNRAVWQAVVQLALLAALLPLLLALTPVYVTEALDQKVSELPVVIFPAILGMLFGLRMVSGLARSRDTAWLGTVGLAVFIGAVVALSLIDVWAEALENPLALRGLDIGVIEISRETQIVMIILLPMGFAFSLVNVAANAILNVRVPVGMQGRVFSLQTVMAGAASIPPLLIGGALTEILDVRIVLGISPVVLVLAWAFARFGTLNPRTARRRTAAAPQ
jgi:MFS family permease